MKPIFWLLTAGLLVVMLAYNIIRDTSSVCQPLQYSQQVFR
jgi:hypothetical protein